jgi:selenocysteine lyase/cysteine desulfurase
MAGINMSGYFLYHSIGTFPGKAEKVKTALERYSDIWSAENDEQWPEMLAQRGHFIQSWERLIGAPAGTMTTAENVTLALYSLIGALPEELLRGRRILAAGDCFPSLHFLLAGLQARLGFTLQTVPMRQGESFVRDEDFIDAWGSDVAIALTTWVSSTTSKLVDLDLISKHGRQHGTIIIADVTQGVGIRPFSVGELDVVVGSSLKWLCGSSGAGAIYVRPQLLTTCKPELRGWFSQPNPFSWDLDSFTYADDARRFDHGTPAVLAAIASQAGLDFVSTTGVDNLARHNEILTGTIVDRVIANSALTLISPEKSQERGGSVMARADTAERAAAIMTGLKAEDFYCDCRGRILRFSPGSVTSEGETQALCDALDRLAVG